MIPSVHHFVSRFGESQYAAKLDLSAREIQVSWRPKVSKTIKDLREYKITSDLTIASMEAVLQESKCVNGPFLMNAQCGCVFRVAWNGKCLSIRELVKDCHDQ